MTYAQATDVSDRLDSWKEIAAYLKRDVRTLRRWEKEQGLPIHRHHHKSLGSVYAYRSELDTWWANSHRQQPETATPAEQPVKGRAGLWIVAGIGAVVLVAAALLAGAAWRARAGTTALRPVMTQLTFNSFEQPITAAALSPDGKYLVFVDPAGVALHTVSTGQSRRLAIDAAVAAIDIAWLPDSTTLIASAADGIWRTSIFGDAPRRIADRGGLLAVSDDGARIAVTAPSNESIRVITADGERVSDLAPPEPHARFSRAAWAPGRARLAYLKAVAAPQRVLSSIETRRVDGSATTTVFSGPVYSLIWAPDGRLLFSRPNPIPKARYATLWQMAIDVTTGLAKSPVSQLVDAPDVTFLHPTITADGGAVAFLLNRARIDVYAADFDAARAEFRNLHRAVPRDTTNVISSWTPSGDGLLFVSYVNGADEIFRQPLDRPEPQDFVVRGGVGVRQAAVSADSRWIYYLPGGRRMLVRVPAAGGTVEDVFAIDGDPDSAWLECGQPPANACVVSTVAGDRMRLVGFDAAQPRPGPEREVPAPASPQAWDLSPDGRRIAEVAQIDGGPRLVVVDAASGATEVRDSPAFARAETVAWLGNRDTWLITKPRGSRGGEVWYVDGDASPRVVWQSAFQRLFSPKLSPDGRHLAFSSGTSESCVWMLQRF